MHRRIAVALTLGALSACTTFAPPPMMMHQTETTFRSEPGAVNLGGFVGGGAAGLPFGDGFLGALGVADVLAPAGWKFGASGAIGLNTSTSSSSSSSPAVNGSLKSGRLFAQYRPGKQDWVAVQLGGGGGSYSRGDLAMNYAGPDLGVSVGHTFGAVRPYLTATGAFSQPFQVDNQTPGSTAQADIDQYTSRVYYAIGGIGVCGDTPSGVELSAELNTGVGWQPHGRTNGMFSLSGGLRYRFGAPRKVAPLPPNLDDEPEDDGGGS